MRIAYADIVTELSRVLRRHGMAADRAAESAQLFADNTLDGVASHGVNRFPRVVSYIEKGYIDVGAQPELEASLGAIERWNGHQGMGNLNARYCMSRAIELAQMHGIGAVALHNTNHWMRGGAYGWQAADRGFAALCWTNTMPNMPAWGGSDRKIGNNPLVVAIPRPEGGHIVFDAALSQYSYGKIESMALEGKRLPFPGGYDESGNLTTDPDAITRTWRVLPIGYWKGSGLSIVLDLLAAILSGGNTTCQIGRLGGDEYRLSQVFIAFNISALPNPTLIQETLYDAITDLKASSVPAGESSVKYPGESALYRRRENTENGIPVDSAVWKTILAL
ncbi:MAG: 3-dehydro-L-gulonate 2-dehydrogenase [Spirochaetaceae bacterium]|nr:MAG: 3-dehydro-L-gulonate 2-dehydrogenase [Spirochaetaceae bacterium]